MRDEQTGITLEGAEYMLDILRQTDPLHPPKDSNGRPITDPAAYLEELRRRGWRVRPSE